MRVTQGCAVLIYTIDRGRTWKSQHSNVFVSHSMKCESMLLVAGHIPHLLRPFNYFPNSILICTAVKLKSSDIRKNKPYSFASIIAVDMRLWIYFISVVMKCYTLWSLTCNYALSRVHRANWKSSFNACVLFTVGCVFKLKARLSCSLSII